MKRASAALGVMLSLALTACGSGTGSISIIGVDPRAELTVDVSGLPAGEAADVHVAYQGAALSLIGTRVLRDLPLGRYDVQAGTVMAGGAPYLPVVSPPSVLFDEGHLRSTVKVRYDLPLTGQLTVNVGGLPASESTTVHVSGPNGFKRDLSGVAMQTLTDLLPGEYNVVADAVRSGDFTYPATVQGSPVRVQRGRTSVTNIAFARDQRFGVLAVRLLGLPDAVPGTVRITDALAQVREQTGSGLVTDLPEGDTLVQPLDVQDGGFTYRAAPVHVSVPSAAVAALDVPFAPITGRLKVVVNSPVTLPAGSITVEGTGDLDPNTLEGTGSLSGSATLGDLFPGTYRITARAFTLGAWTYVPDVASSTVSVAAGQTAGQSITYTPLAARTGLERDVAAPQVTLDTGVLGDDHTLRGHVMDFGASASGVARVQVYLGSQVLGEASVTEQGEWSLVWADAPAGEQELTVVATDQAGNEARVVGSVVVGPLR